MAKTKRYLNILFTEEPIEETGRMTDHGKICRFDVFLENMTTTVAAEQVLIQMMLGVVNEMTSDGTKDTNDFTSQNHPGSGTMQ